MEIESKFRVSDTQVFAWIRRLESLGPYRLQSDPQIQEQHNTYYDTADGTLQQARYGLRLRMVPGEQTIATLKSSGTIEDGLAERDEWEVAASAPDPATWPESEARTQALALVGSAPLVELVTVITRRQRIMVMHSGCEVAEVSLDEGTISAAGQRRSFCELEVELLPLGTRADFDAFVAELRKQANLVPENRSKLERGLELLHRQAAHEQANGR